MEPSSLPQTVLHDIHDVQPIQQPTIHIQHGIHDIQNHHNNQQHDSLFRSLFRDENHFICPQQDIFAHHPHPNDAASPPPQLQQLVDRPLDLDDEPLYVNAKQYFRILKRRVARTRLEELHRLSRQRKVCVPFLGLFFSLFASHAPLLAISPRIPP